MKFVFNVRLLLLEKFGDWLARIANCVVAHDLGNDNYILMLSSKMLYVDSANDLRNRFSMKNRLVENIIKNGDREVVLIIDRLSGGLKNAMCQDDAVNNAIVQKSIV